MSGMPSSSTIFLQDESGSWTPVVGLKVSRWRLAREPVDITLSGDQGWRRLLPGAGKQVFEVEGTGVAVDPFTMDQLHGLAMTGSRALFKIALDPSLTITGDFIFTSFEARAEVDEEPAFAFVLGSACPITAASTSA